MNRPLRTACRRLSGCAPSRAVTLTALALALGTAPSARAEPGVNAERILFGQSASFTGVAKESSHAARSGVLAAFEEVNARGGVHGRRLELDSLDDGYEPERAVANTRELVERRGVFAMIASFGTPTSEAVLPRLAADGVPYLGPISGAPFLRDPGHGNVVNLRPGYREEAADWIAHLRRDLGARRVAILHQNDAFGRSVLAASLEALDDANMRPVAVATYERDTVAVKRALLKIRRKDPDVVLMGSSHRPTAAFVRTARELGMDTVFMTVSLARADTVHEILGASAAGIVFTQVLPSPLDESLAAAVDYRRALAASDPEAVPDAVGLEGYLIARLVADRLQAVGRAPTRRALLDGIAALTDHDLGGIALRFGPDDNQGIDHALLSVLQADGEVRYVERLDRAALGGSSR